MSKRLNLWLVGRVILAAIGVESGPVVAPGKPDDSILYKKVRDGRCRWKRAHQPGPRGLWRFRLRPDWTIEPGNCKLVFDWQNGHGPDGVKMGREGRL